MDRTSRLSDGQRFAILADALGICIWEGIVTSERAYVELSAQGLASLFGEEPTEADAEAAVLARLHPDDHDTYMAWTDLADNVDRKGLRYRVRHADGSWRTIEERMSPVADTPDGMLLVGIMTDVTERADVERELERSNRDLQEFAHVASHDLQEPLRKIMTFGERLEQRARDLDDTSLGYLERMTNAAQRMSRLITDLLAFSRAQTETPELETIDLGDVVAGVLDDLEVAISARAATVVVGDLPALVADPSQMCQLFQNLIGNALKFQREGVQPEVMIDARRRGSTWRITVKDNGVGFDQEHAAKMFAVFQRLHARDQFEGSGIGLSVCRRIVERHGGTIEARGVVGAGSTFTIDLPVVGPVAHAA